MIAERQDYFELDSVEEAYAKLDNWDIFQIKYDGIWARIVIDAGMITVYSRTGQEKHRFATMQRDFFFTGRVELIGEFMFGSQWAQREDRRGKLFVFDCVMADSTDISAEAYSSRYRVAREVVTRLGEPFRLVECGKKTSLGGFWLTQKAEFEGVVLRKWTDNYHFAVLYKLKYEVQDDFVVINMVEGNGKYEGSMGALVLGQYNTDEQLVEVMRVGGGFDDETRQRMWDFKADFIGKVCMINGKARFDSGAIRHPEFIAMRSDKQPIECRLKSKLS